MQASKINTIIFFLFLLFSFTISTSFKSKVKNLRRCADPETGDIGIVDAPVEAGEADSTQGFGEI